MWQIVYTYGPICSIDLYSDTSVTQNANLTPIKTNAYVANLTHAP